MYGKCTPLSFEGKSVSDRSSEPPRCNGERVVTALPRWKGPALPHSLSVASKGTTGPGCGRGRCLPQPYCSSNKGKEDSLFVPVDAGSPGHRASDPALPSSTETKPRRPKEDKTRKSGRRVKKVVNGWTELFSTITEDPTMEEEAEKVPSFASKGSSSEASTWTFNTHSTVPEFVKASTACIAAATSTGSFPDEAPACGQLEPASCCFLQWGWAASSQVNSQSADTGPGASCLTDSGPETGSENADTDEVAAEVTESSEGMNLKRFFKKFWPISGVWRVPFGIADILLTLSEVFHGSNEFTTSKDKSVTSTPSNEEFYDVSSGHQIEARQEPVHSQRFYQKFVTSDESAYPERGILLILTVGLLLAVFAVSSVSLSRSRFHKSAPIGHGVEKAANVEGGLNSTGFDERPYRLSTQEPATTEETFEKIGPVSPAAK